MIININTLKEMNSKLKDISVCLKSEKQIETLNKLDAEFPIIFRSLKWCFGSENAYLFQLDREKMLMGMEMIGLLGSFFWMRGRTKEILPIVENLIPQTSFLSNIPKRIEAHLYFTVGQIYYASTNYESSIRSYFKALELFTELKEERFMGDVLNELGRVYREKFDLRAAKTYHLESLELYKQERGVEDLYGIALANSNLGVISYREDKLDESLKYHKRALKIREEIQDKLGEASSLGNIALISMKIKKYDEAKKFYMISLKIRDLLGDKWGVAGSHLSLAKAELSLKDYPACVRHLIDSHTLFQSVNDRLGFAEVCEILVPLLYKTKNKYELILVMGMEKIHRNNIGTPLSPFSEKLRKRIKKKINYKKYESAKDIGKTLDEIQSMDTITNLLSELKTHSLKLPKKHKPSSFEDFLSEGTLSPNKNRKEREEKQRRMEKEKEGSSKKKVKKNEKDNKKDNDKKIDNKKKDKKKGIDKKIINKKDDLDVLNQSLRLVDQPKFNDLLSPKSKSFSVDCSFDNFTTSSNSSDKENKKKKEKNKNNENNNNNNNNNIKKEKVKDKKLEKLKNKNFSSSVDLSLDNNKTKKKSSAKDDKKDLKRKNMSLSFSPLVRQESSLVSSGGKKANTTLPAKSDKKDKKDKKKK